ncbi:MAG TPA: hypothetical protein VGF38_09165 [Ktedonobacterales bacterium]|jgi:hypothetical protein
MPATLAPKLTVAAAAKRTAVTLNLEDDKRLAIALAEAAAEEVSRNSRFEALVRAIYGALTPAPKSPTKSAQPSAFDAQLVPIKEVEGRPINPAAPLDPYYLLEVYGPSQLPTALGLFPLKKLQEGVELVQERYPNTRPAGKTKAAVIGYIVEYVAPPQG